MKNKNRKGGKHRRTARHGARTAHAKRRRSVKKTKGDRAPAPWLRMVSNEMDDEPRAGNVRDFLSRRNGRRQPRDLDLYIPEDKSQTR